MKKFIFENERLPNVNSDNKYESTLAKWIFQQEEKN